MMRILTISLAVLASTCAHAQSQAPFCLVSNTGHPSCFYYSADACRSAQQTLGGMCSVNSVQAQAAPRVVLQHPDIAGAAQRGYQAGQEMRMREQEHRSRMAVLDAQRASLEAQSAPLQIGVPAQSTSQPTVFRCRLQSGGVYYTSMDIEGCAQVQYQPSN